MSGVRVERCDVSARGRPSLAGLARLAPIVILAVFCQSFGAAAAAAGEPGAAAEWPRYGGARGATRYTPLREITPQNLDRLRVAWVHHSGDVSDGRGEMPATSAYEATPILVDGTLYVCSPFNRVFALDPETGAERWVYDPKIDRSARYANQLVCRGVAAWRGERRAGAVASACGSRIFTATNDARLIALDAKSGRPCAGFGEGGGVDLTRGVGQRLWKGEYQMTSAPAVIGDLVVVGSAVSDNARTDAPSGVVRGFDARSGALRWSWNALDEKGNRDTPGARGHYRLGTANVWAPITVDEARGLLFVPTGNVAPDYFGGLRAGRDAYASSVVALRAATGAVAWHYQTVHHDLWDYDAPAQPSLFDWPGPKGPVPALVQPTKMGYLFVLDRRSGRPLLPVEERRVATDGVPGEKLSPTQPVPVRPPPLVPEKITADDIWGLTPWDRGWCRRRLAELRHDGIFTPPTTGGSLMVPGNAGGSNWGGVAVDPERHVAVANVSHLPFEVTLFPAEQYAAIRAAHPHAEIGPQRGTPYGVLRRRFVSPWGLPCVKPPWGELVAVDLARGTILWHVPLGGVRDLLGIPLPWAPGTPNLGGPLVTASGLVFIGAAMDDYLRAFDLRTGEELWYARLPAGGQATPMSYRVHPGGRQYVVIAAGGHGRAGTRLGDSLVAYALEP